MTAPSFDRAPIASLPASGRATLPTADRFHDGFREANISKLYLV